MSIRVGGILELNKIGGQSNEEEILNKKQLYFFIEELAVKNKIGVNLRIDISILNFKVENKDIEIVPFEIIDHPRDVNAECLFIGDGVSLHVCGVRIDEGESLLSRMSRIQNFMNELLKNKYINKIILDVNIEPGDEFETIEIKVSNFCEKMLELYKRENNWTPTIRVIVERN